MKINTLITGLLLIAIAGCQKANDKNPALLGKWQGTEWLVFDAGSDMDATQVEFEFRDDGTFTAQFGDQKKQGTWRTSGDKLYTTETGMQEIMVKLLKANGSNLDFEMNRGGRKETLKFKKL